MVLNASLLAEGQSMTHQALKGKTQVTGLTAREVMTPTVFTVRASDSIEDTVQLLASQHISGVPVVDGERQVIGILSEADLIDEHKREAAIPRTLLYGLIPLPNDVLAEAAHRGKILRADDLMTRPVVTATENMAVHELADLMVQRRINRIPVVRDGRLVGIVTRSDLVRALAQGAW
jgi:CBS domain-containing protein